MLARLVLKGTPIGLETDGGLCSLRPSCIDYYQDYTIALAWDDLTLSLYIGSLNTLCDDSTFAATKVTTTVMGVHSTGDGAAHLAKLVLRSLRCRYLPRILRKSVLQAILPVSELGRILHPRLLHT